MKLKCIIAALLLAFITTGNAQSVITFDFNITESQTTLREKDGIAIQFITTYAESSFSFSKEGYPELSHGCEIDVFGTNATFTGINFTFQQNGKTVLKTWKPSSKEKVTSTNFTIDRKATLLKIEVVASSIINEENNTSGVDYVVAPVTTPVFDNNVYNLQGILVRRNNPSTEGLAPGIYIINGQKIIVK